MSETLARRMTASCRRFLDALDDEARERATFAFGDDERFVWHYTPIERRGIPMGDLSAESVELAHELLAVPLSDAGASTARGIMAHEEILGRIEGAAGGGFFERDPGLYLLSVFGDPSDDPWGWRIDGHHLSLHLTVVGGEIASPTPSFFGANPAEVPGGQPEAGLRLLGPLEDLGRELYRSVGETALIDAEAPADVVTTNRPEIEPVDPGGIAGADMTDAQGEGFVRLLDAYLARLREPLRDEARERIGDVAGLHFAWAGGAEPGEPHYYRITGGGFLVEYDNTQDGANHIHTVWRDAEGDFGRDLLAEHHREAHSG